MVMKASQNGDIEQTENENVESNDNIAISN